VYVLDGTGSGDIDGDILLYSWELIDAPAGVDIGSFVIGDADTAAPYFETYIKQGNYKFELTVNDQRGFGTEGSGDDEASIVIDTVVITINNLPPELYCVSADPGSVNIEDPDPANHVVNLEAEGGDSNGADTITFTWSFDSKPAGSVLTDGDINNYGDGTADFTPDVTGTYVVRATLSDGEFSDSNTIVVTAYDDSQGGIDVIIQ
jgi:hypothetical protein